MPPPAPYPPDIQHATFATPPPPPLNIAVPCSPQDPKQCGIQALTLSLAPNDTGATSFDAAHGPLVARAPGRYTLAPGKDSAFINWAFENPEHILSARLDIYYQAANAAVHLWTKTLVWNPGECPATGATPFDGKLSNDPAQCFASQSQDVAIIYPGGNPSFPSDHLNVQQAPYKLVMTLVSVTGATVHIRERWLYIDVEVSGLELRLGSADFIPRPAAPADQGFHRRNRQLHAHVDSQLTQGRMPENKDFTLRLEGNCFSAKSGDMSDSTSYDAWRDLWRDGPYLPLVATISVRGLSGQSHNAPQAIIGARFLWDWHGRQALDLNGIQQQSHAVMNKAYDDWAYQMNQFATAKAGYNVMEANGGRQHYNQPLFKHADDGHTRFQAGGTGDFPFPMSECRQRGAVMSEPRADGLLPSQTGVLFTPSILSEDQFQLSVYFAYGDRNDWDQPAQAAAHDLPHAVPHARTGVMTVRRGVRIARHWVPPGTWGPGTFTWDKLVDEFRGCGIDFDTRGAQRPTHIDRQTFARLLTAEVRKLAPITHPLFAPEDEQLREGYAIKLRTYDELCNEMLKRYKLYRAPYKQQFGEQPGPLLAFLKACADHRGGAALNLPQTLMDLLPRLAGLEWTDVLSALDTPAPADLQPSSIQFLLAQNPTDKHLKRELVRFAHGYANEAAYLEDCKDLTEALLKRVCGKLIQAQAPDEPGLHVFQFDFENNFDMFSASGWGFSTPSNRANCPECDHPLTPDEKEQRRCGTCNTVLRDEASLMTLVPLTLVRPIGMTDVFANLKGLANLINDPTHPRNETLAKQFTLESMPGVRAEVLVAHEMGHQLFLPHSPSGFDQQDIDANFPMGFTQRKVLGEFLTALGQNQGLLQQLQNATRPGGNKASFHNSDHRACMMGYNFAALSHMHFCAKCILRLRGWNTTTVEII